MGIRKRIGLQSIPYVGLVSTMVLFIWLIAVGVGIAILVYAMFKESSDLDYLGPVGFPLVVLGAVVIRTAIYLLVECTLLFEAVGKRQYHRWASSFNRDDPTNNAAKVEDSQLLSYQYRPWWIAILVIFGAIGLIIFGLKVRGMLWATIPGAALLAETVLRFGLELLWLHTSFASFVKPLLLRWIPWLSISIRQY